MMGRTKLATASYDTSQKSFRRPENSVGYVVIHHAATTSMGALVSLVMGSRQVSSTLGVKDDQIVSFMDEEFRAWSLSSEYWDSVSMSVETCNSGGAAEGWPISEASYVSLAAIVRDWCARYGIPCDRAHIIGHREVYSRFGASYATACPGGIDLDRVVAMASSSSNLVEDDDMTIADPYIWTKDGGKNGAPRYALLDLSLPEGSHVTENAKEAELYSWLVWDKIKQGAPLEVNGFLFDKKIAGAKLVTSKRLAAAGGSTVVNNVVDAATITAIAKQVADLLAARLKE